MQKTCFKNDLNPKWRKNWILSFTFFIYTSRMPWHICFWAAATSIQSCFLINNILESFKNKEWCALKNKEWWTDQSGSATMTSQHWQISATILACFILGIENDINLQADSHSGSNLLKRNINWLKWLSWIVYLCASCKRFQWCYICIWWRTIKKRKNENNVRWIC